MHKYSWAFLFLSNRSIPRPPGWLYLVFKHKSLYLITPLSFKKNFIDCSKSSFDSDSSLGYKSESCLLIYKWHTPIINFKLVEYPGFNQNLLLCPTNPAKYKLCFFKSSKVLLNNLFKSTIFFKNLFAWHLSNSKNASMSSSHETMLVFSGKYLLINILWFLMPNSPTIIFKLILLKHLLQIYLFVQV